MGRGPTLALGTLAVLGVAGLGLAVPRSRPVDAGMLPVLYAVPSETLEVHSLGRGETFGQLLDRASLDANEQQAVLLAFREQASPRRMRVGTEVTLRRRASDGWLRGLDVELSPDETVQLTRDPMGWISAVIATPVWTDTLFASGTIDDVLWNAVAGNPRLGGMSPSDRALLIHRLDQVFQWQVDFSRQIQPGDYYRFVFERLVRPDGSMRDGRLLGAELVNSGASLFAFWFDPSGDGYGSYYDAEGLSVRRAFLRKPLEFRRISSRFSNSRFHPILRTWRAHRGVDYSAASGTEVMATADGVIVKRGRNGSYGNLVEIRHANGFITRYAHLSRFDADARLGVRVRQGQVIGYVGMTGLATAPHLHYEMRRGDRALDPLSVELPAGDPVPEEAWDLWLDTHRGTLALLNRVPSGPAPTVATLKSADELESTLPAGPSQGGQ